MFNKAQTTSLGPQPCPSESICFSCWTKSSINATFLVVMNRIALLRKAKAALCLLNTPSSSGRKRALSLPGWTERARYFSPQSSHVPSFVGRTSNLPPQFGQLWKFQTNSSAKCSGIFVIHSFMGIL